MLYFGSKGSVLLACEINKNLKPNKNGIAL